MLHVNTLLLQDILSEEKWQKRLTDGDRRAVSPLFWTHVNPYLDTSGGADPCSTALALATNASHAA
ncbi:Tn3 family transposase [Streptomyces sp. TRM68367]|uniref:Tn3 family transposase n=1 Tax=Streptomyces sp. TRM68367 TaxID=2758415 RepID=UPI00165A9ED2|nr:Tn3 family transposase [Streptomyces sp. TRM68367]